MSEFSDNQRRLVCRLLFLVCCLLPTTITTYWICHPQTATGWARILSAELGIETDVGDVQAQGPFTTVLNDITFRYGQQALFHTVEARIKFDARHGHVIIPYEVDQIDNLKLTHLVQRINQHAIRTGSNQQSWRIDFVKDLIIQRSALDGLPASADPFNQWQQQLQNQLTIANLRIDVDPSQTRIYFNFRNTDGTLMEPAATLMIDSNQQQIVRLDTQNGQLPLWTLAGIDQSIADSLGPEAKFQGRLTINPDRQHLESLVGSFHQVETSYQGQEIGLGAGAHIEVQSCEFVDGKFVRWDATLSSESIAPTHIYQDYFFINSQRIALQDALRRTALDSLRLSDRTSPDTTRH